MQRNATVRVRLFVPLLAASACFSPTEPVAELDLSLSLSSNRMRPDSGIVVRVAATNRTSHTLNLETTGRCVVTFRVIPPVPVNVGPNFGCRSVLIPVEVPAGAAIEQEFLLLPRPRMSPDGPVRWPAGRYQVVGILLGRRIGVVRETEPKEFELVCRDPAWTEC